MFDPATSNATVASFCLPPTHGKQQYRVQQQQQLESQQQHVIVDRTQTPLSTESGSATNSSCSVLSLDWKPNTFMQQYIIPKDSIFNRSLQGDVSSLVTRTLRHHDKLAHAVRPHKAPLQISAIEREARRILRGNNQEIGVTSGSFANAIMAKMQDQSRRRKSISEISGVNLNSSSTTAAGESFTTARTRYSIGGNPITLGRDNSIAGNEQATLGHHRHRGRSVHGGITEESEMGVSPSAGSQQLRKVSRALGKIAIHPAFQRQLHPLAERFRRAAKSVCKAVRNSKVDGRIGLHDVLKQHQGRDEELELMSTESHVLSPEAMEIWYKDTQQRTSADLDYLERGVALIKCFNKYSASVRRELCRVAKFECFQDGRMLLKQGHDPTSMYFIISGTVEVVKSETDMKTGKIYTQTVAVLHPGDGFGDVALINRTKRTASAVCRSDVKLLRVDGEDYQEVLEMAVEQELRGKWEFLRSLNLFHDMEDMPEMKRLAEVGVLKEYQQNSIIHKDIVNSDDIYFIRKGSCRVVQAVDFVKEEFPNDRFNLHQYPDNYTCKPNEKIITKLLTVESLAKGCFFGARSLAEAQTKRQGLTDVFVKKIGLRGLAVISNSKTECILIKKVDFLRFVTEKCFETLREEVLQKVVSSKEVVASFLASRAWANLKREMITEIFESRQILEEHQHSLIK